MKVRLKQTWFTPTEKVNMGAWRVFAGKRFRPGVHELPDEMFDLLPKSAVIMEAPAAMPIEAEVTVKEIEEKIPEALAAREMTMIQEAHDAAEEQRKENRKRILTKARAAKALKKREQAREEEAE